VTGNKEGGKGTGRGRERMEKEGGMERGGTEGRGTQTLGPSWPKKASYAAGVSQNTVLLHSKLRGDNKFFDHGTVFILMKR